MHIHADLIAGLPGESLESFAAGFDRLVALGPHEIQVGILKRLRGTPIVRHDAEWQMVYNPHPPYEILQNRLIDFATMQKLRRFARYWDLVGNSGNFVETTPLIWSNAGEAAHVPPLAPRASAEGIVADEGRTTAESGSGGTPAPLSPFASFMRWSEWLYARTGRTDSIALVRLMELLFEFLTVEAEAGPAGNRCRHVARLPAWRTPRPARLPEGLSASRNSKARAGSRPARGCQNDRPAIGCNRALMPSHTARAIS